MGATVNTSKKLTENISCSKIILLLSFLLFVISVIIAWANPTANSISLSIYSDTPLAYWILSIFSTGLAVWIIIFSCRKTLIKIAWISFVLNILSFIFLTIIRGYFSTFVESDHGSHLGTILEILQTGNFAESNHYPILHIFSAMFSSVTDINYVTASNFLSAVFVVLFLLGVVLLIRTIVPYQYQRHSLLIIGMCPLWFGGVFFLGMPVFMGLALFPISMWLILQILINEKFSSYIIILTLLFIALPMIHESVGLIVLIDILCAIFALILFRGIKMYKYNKITALKNQNIKSTSNHSLQALITLFILCGVYVIFWISHFTLGSLTSVLASVISPYRDVNVGVSYVKDMNRLEIIQYMNIPDLIYFASTYGGYVMFGIVFIVAAISVPILLKKITADNQKICLCSLLLFTMAMLLATVFVFAVNVHMGYSRFLNFSAITPIILIGFFMAYLLKKGRVNKQSISRKIIAVCLVTILIFVPHFFSYSSVEFDQSFSSLDSETQVSGIEFIMTHTNLNNRVYSITDPIQFFRFSQLLWGMDTITTKNNLEYKAGTTKQWTYQQSLEDIDSQSYITLDNKQLEYHDKSFYYRKLPDNLQVTYKDAKVVGEQTNKLFQNPRYVLLLSK